MYSWRNAEPPQIKRGCYTAKWFPELDTDKCSSFCLEEHYYVEYRGYFRVFMGDCLNGPEIAVNDWTGTGVLWVCDGVCDFSLFFYVLFLVSTHP